MARNFIFRISLSLLALGTAFVIGRLTAKKQVEIVSKEVGRDHSKPLAPLNSTTSSKPELSSNVDPFDEFSFIPENSEKIDTILAIARHRDSVARSKAILALVDTLSRSDFPAVVQSLEESGLQDLRKIEYGILLTAWAQVAPEEAMGHASRLFDGTFAKNTILETWATEDPGAALAWARGSFASPDSHEPNPWLLGVVRGAIASDLELAGSVFDSMPRDTQEREDALSTILSNLHATDPQLAQEWAYAMEDSEDRSEALAIVARNMALTDPVGASNWVSSLEDPSALAGVAEYIAHDRYYDSPEATKDWVTRLPEWAVGKAANAVVMISTKEDPLETAQWMSGLLTTNPDGNYDPAVKTLVDDATLIAPQISAEWITALSSEREQERLYHKVLSYWTSEDQVAAQTWVEYNYKDLPESVLLRYFPDLVPEFGSSNSDQGAY
ncbi:hypothetical protein MLD52_19425 [Puniceicoccaceae bacterium K14]|nr:hypothetical protein [Puniceicoccaceae bacterium K14]